MKKISNSSCLSWSAAYSLTWILTGAWCNVLLDWSTESKQFLSKLKLTGTFQDPINDTVNGDDFVYEFSYLLGWNQY